MATTTDLIPLVPEMFVLGAALVLLIVDLFLDQARRGITHFLAIMILVLATILRKYDLRAASDAPVRAMVRNAAIGPRDEVELLHTPRRGLSQAA